MYTIMYRQTYIGMYASVSLTLGTYLGILR